MKYNEIEVVNNLSTSGTLYFDNGYIFLGQNYESTEYNEENNLPDKSYAGTSETRGNISRNVFNLNQNGPILFNETNDDRKQILQKFTNIIANNPILTTFPWLYTTTFERTENTQTAIGFSNNFPIYKCLGKGLGEVTFFKCGSAFNGDESKAGAMTATSSGQTTGTYSQGDIIYPFDGYIYSGTLVQMIQEDNETKVIPYQSGRGIPLYALDFQTLLSFPPFGELKWPLSGNTLSPVISQGVEPGNNNACLGIVLDTYSIEKQELFNYSEPSGFSSAQLEEEKFYEHPAPQSIPAKSKSTSVFNGYLSAGPNTSGTFFSPWPKYYAYKSGDPVPVLTKGITTARIGAAYNIALTSFLINRQITTSTQTRMAISAIPLFQGERVEAGSYIYASTKGNIITPGPFLPETYSRTLVPGSTGQTPWDIFIDSTWGNVGWAGTPGLSFSNIPDQGVAIIETVDDLNSIPYLNQSNQGSIIVHAVSTIGPTPSIGNNYNQDQFNLPGISGRGMLSQTVPEKAQPIGIILETIEGSGKWTYTAARSDANFDPTIVIPTGGANYPDPSVNIPLRGGDGAGAEGNWTEFNSAAPFLGTITGGLTIPVPGAGYTNGDVLTFQDDTISYNQTPQYKGNNASVKLNTVGPSIELHPGGSGYPLLFFGGNDTFNLSLNNAYLDFQSVAGVLGEAETATGPDYFQDFTRYPAGTIVRVLDNAVLKQNSAFFTVNSLSYANVSLTSITGGSTYPNVGGIYYETSNVSFPFRPPYMKVLNATVTDDSVTVLEVIDYGAGNLPGDFILILGGNNNCVCRFPEIAPGQQELTWSAPNYSAALGPYETVRLTDNVDDGLRVDVIQDTSIAGLNIPVAVTVDTPAVGADPMLYRVRYTGGFQIAEPWYHCNCLVVLKQSSNYSLIAGGGGFTPTVSADGLDNNLPTYNLTANSLRLQFSNVSNRLVSLVNPHMSATDNNYKFIQTRYVFDPVNGTELEILGSDTGVNDIIKLTGRVGSVISIEFIVSGNTYSASSGDGNYIYQTQRRDQVNPTVDVFTEATGVVILRVASRVRLNTLGSNNEANDLMLVLAVFNTAVFIFNNNMPTIDLPPFATVPNYLVDGDYERYSNVITSSVNLLDKQVLVELRSTNDQTMENITPYGVSSGGLGTPFQESPPANNVYREFYPN